MTTKHSPAVALIAFIAFTSPTFGFPEPSFYLDSCAWDATNIVIVSEGDKIDGIVEVKESWKGDLKRGDILTVPEVAQFASEKPRAIRKRHFAFVDEDSALGAGLLTPPARHRRSPLAPSPSAP